MTDDRKSGIALLAGSIGTLVTMAIHPQGSRGLTEAQYVHLATASAVAHTLAIVSMVIFALAAIGLTRRLSAREAHVQPAQPDRLALAGIVTYSVALFAIVIAAAVSGFIVPRIFIMMVRDEASAAPQWHIVAAAVFQFNLVFSRIYTVAASAAIILWSMSGLRNGGIGRKIAVYGCVSGAVLIVLILIGHLRLDVHGMTAVVLAQAIWFIVVGVQLVQADSTLPHEAGGHA